MSILNRARARREKEIAEKPRVRVAWDANGVIQWPEEKEEHKPASNIRQFIPLPAEQDDPEVNGQCNHCGGSGRYLIHTKRVWGKCFRCNGTGVIDTADLAFLARRQATGAPICRVYGGL